MSGRRLPLIYIAGPFRGPTPLDVRRNVERARDLGLLVTQAGAYPVIPHTMTAEFDKQGEDQFWLDGTMEMLRRCDAIVLTEDWERSTGARTEFTWSMENDMPSLVYFDIGPRLREDRLREFVAAVVQLGSDRLSYERVKRDATV